MGLLQELDISTVEQISAGSARPILSFVFEPGKRPDAEGVLALSQQPTHDGRPFAVTHQPAAEDGWLELLVGGLVFDCRGLEPAAPAAWPQAGSLLGLDHAPTQGEAVALLPGPHIARVVALPPVLRALVGLGARLSALPGLLAVCWEPSQSWMEPAYFRKVAEDWLSGGPFPALGLTALERLPDGALRSLGLGFLIGQELSIAGDPNLSSSQQARIAVRFINELINSGPLAEAREFIGPDGEKLLARPIPNGRLVKIGLRH